MTDTHTPDTDADRSDAIIVREKRQDGKEVRTRYEPLESGYLAIDEHWTGDGWHTQGSTRVEYVAITTPEGGEDV